MLPRLPKPRRFKHHFRFSDPVKKEREARNRFQESERKRAAEGADGESILDIGRMRSRQNAKSNRRLVIILAVLIALVVLVFIY